jgi:peptide/nickel transport system substrate-binding protein
VNQQAVIDDHASGRGAPTNTGIPAASWAHSDAPGRGFSPGDAARALELAGWARAADGIRRRGDLRLAFTLSAPNDPERVAMAEHVARQLQSVGAEVEVLPIDAATYIDQHLLPRLFETALVEIDHGADPDPYPFWHSSEAVAPGRNISGFSSAELDDVLQRGRLTADAARRTELYDDFASYIIAGAPFIPLYTPHWVYVQSADVKGTGDALLSSTALRFTSAHEWYVNTRVR